MSNACWYNPVMQLQPAMAPKPKSLNPKVYILGVRLNASQMDLLTQAAKLARNAELDDFTVSAWARSVLIAEARKVLRRAREQ
jgi:uncharacterized protein (DUF1778 family)